MRKIQIILRACVDTFVAMFSGGNMLATGLPVALKVLAANGAPKCDAVCACVAQVAEDALDIGRAAAAVFLQGIGKAIGV